jgi:hypothetical protein
MYYSDNDSDSCLREDQGIIKPTLVSIENTENQGSPKKIVPHEFLQTITHRNLPATQLANGLGIHHHTLWNCIKENTILCNYSCISDEELDDFVQNFRKANPESGLRYLIGFLRSQGLRIQIDCVKMSFKRVDGLGQ